jgi:hypothetical protein
MARRLALLVLFALPLWACDCDQTILPMPPPECDEAGKGCLSDERCVEGRCIKLDNCEEDTDCPSLAWECVFPQRVCELRPGFGEECAEGTDCEPGWFCALGICREIADSRQCSRRSDCPLGQKCDREVFLCIEEGPCTLEETYPELACDPDEVCESFSERCQLPCQGECTPATEEADCGIGSRCDGACRCVQCLTDDDCGAGLVCNQRAGRCESEDLCYSDDDCDAPLICEPSTALCQVPPPPCESDLDCEIAEICNRTTGACELPGGECLDDRFENADTPATAEPMDLVADGLPVLVDDLVLCPDDDDVYGLTLAAGDNLVARVMGTATQARATAWLLDSEGETSVRFAEAPPFGNGTISYVAQTEETVFLRVNALSGQTPYDLELVRIAGQPCAADPFEGPGGNNTLENATPAASVPTDVTLVGAICPGDQDYLTIDLASGEGIDVTLDFDAGATDLDLSLLDAETGALLTTSSGITAPEHVRLRTYTDRSVVVYVAGFGNNDGDYQLTLERLPPFECTADATEPDDDAMTAVPVPAGADLVAQPRTMCAGDLDTFAVPLLDFERLVARATFASAELQVQMRVLSEDGETVLREAPQSEGGQTLTWDAQGDQTVLLQLEGLFNTQAAYTLDLLRENQVSCAPDAFEPNDSPQGATDAPVGGAELTICGGDNDWFAVEGAQGKQLRARASFLHGDGDIDLQLIGLDGVQILATSDSISNVEEVEAEMPLDGIYYVRVFSLSSGAKTRYDLLIDVHD